MCADGSPTNKQAVFNTAAAVWKQHIFKATLKPTTCLAKLTTSQLKYSSTQVLVNSVQE